MRRPFARGGGGLGGLGLGITLLVLVAAPGQGRAATRHAEARPASASASATAASATAASASAPPASTPAAAPSLDEELGQILIVGFRGLKLPARAVILRDIRERHLGGVILFNRDLANGLPGRNVKDPEQLALLVRQLRSAAPQPLIVAIDQEGGMVRRLRAPFGLEATSAAELGRADDVEATRSYAAKTAAVLASLGINLNLAPVVDLNLNPDNPAIGKVERSFGADPALVVRHARAVIEAHRARGVLTAVKHFPGQGSARTDSHAGMPDVTETWSDLELVPFRELVAAGMCDVVMTAHIFNARLDDELPATLSRRVVDGVLRQQLGYDGVVISDDLGMGAIKTEVGLARAIELALGAGIDILVFANNTDYDEHMTERVLRTMKGLLRRGRITKEQIDRAYARVQRLKAHLAP